MTAYGVSAFPSPPGSVTTLVIFEEIELPFVGAKVTTLEHEHYSWAAFSESSSALAVCVEEILACMNQLVPLSYP